MSSLHRVIKQGRLVDSGEVFKIPDEEPLPVQQEPDEEIEDAEEAAESQTEAQNSFEAMRQQKLIDQANDISHKIMQSAKAEREKILEQAQQEALEIRQDAWNTGYQEAISKKEAEITNCIAQVEQLMQQLEEDHKSFIQQYEEGLNDLAIEIAEKVLKEAVHETGDLMVSLVKDAVSAVRNANWISIQVSDKLPGLVDTLKRELSDTQSLRHAVEVSAGEFPEDTCIVQTPEGVLDASVSEQINNLKTVLARTE